MTLQEKLLHELSDWKPLGEGRHSWAAAYPAEGWTVLLTTDKADSLACAAWELSLSRIGEPPAGLTLAQWAAAIADRATGLGQSLQVYEVDVTRGEAVLRSEVPLAKGDSLTYFEVRLSGLASAVVRRFSATKHECGRTQTAFAMTHEALAQLAADIAG